MRVTGYICFSFPIRWRDDGVGSGDPADDRFRLSPAHARQVAGKYLLVTAFEDGHSMTAFEDSHQSHRDVLRPLPLMPGTVIQA